ncbi:hypothetical protein MTO96_007964 [Rhipicephalus appendiculatus]
MAAERTTRAATTPDTARSARRAVADVGSRRELPPFPARSPSVSAATRSRSRYSRTRASMSSSSSDEDDEAEEVGEVVDDAGPELPPPPWPAAEPSLAGGDSSPIRSYAVRLAGW